MLNHGSHRMYAHSCKKKKSQDLKAANANLAEADRKRRVQDEALEEARNTLENYEQSIEELKKKCWQKDKQAERTGAQISQLLHKEEKWHKEKESVKARGWVWRGEANGVGKRGCAQVHRCSHRIIAPFHAVCHCILAPLHTPRHCHSCDRQRWKGA